jgi:hypothetical protein
MDMMQPYPHGVLTPDLRELRSCDRLRMGFPMAKCHNSKTITILFDDHVTNLPWGNINGHCGHWPLWAMYPAWGVCNGVGTPQKGFGPMKPVALPS